MKRDTLYEVSETGPERAFSDLWRGLDEPSLTDTLRRVWQGLRQPRGSGDNSFARLQLLRLSAPASGVAVPLLVLLVLATAAARQPPTRLTPPLTILDPVSATLDPIPPTPDVPALPPEPAFFDPRAGDAAAPGPADFGADPVEAASIPDTVSVPGVLTTKSPVILTGIFRSRTSAAMERERRRHRAPGGCDDAVLRALRWLQAVQESDGSWNGASGGGHCQHRAPAAMTGLALLTFLAHGETPASDEFGDTVRRAIEWLILNRDSEGGWPRRYEHAIASYAVCEAYSVTRRPDLREAAERSIALIARGQNPAGGWRYTLQPGDASDTSCMGWCAQALKAAGIARVADADATRAMRQAVAGFQGNFNPAGFFGYTGPSGGHETRSGLTGLTGVGVLCLQLLGRGESAEARAGTAYLAQHGILDWDRLASWRALYYWYYDTQARFHAGGDAWKTWNPAFATMLVSHQTVLRAGGAGGRDTGYWTTAGTGGEGDREGLVLNTTLCALMLQVYYRYLGTYGEPEDIPTGDDARDGATDIRIDVRMPGPA